MWGIKNYSEQNKNCNVLIKVQALILEAPNKNLILPNWCKFLKNRQLIDNLFRWVLVERDSANVRQLEWIYLDQGFLPIGNLVPTIGNNTVNFPQVEHLTCTTRRESMAIYFEANWMTEPLKICDNKKLTVFQQYIIYF